MDISNGEGIGISLFVQGCHFKCKNCFNKSTWDFNGGEEWTDYKENTFINLANKNYISRISILGGEPLADENVLDVLKLIQKIRNMYGNSKKIWIYTGYSIEDIINFNINQQYHNIYNFARNSILTNIDILVDGKYIEELKDINYKFAGSTNQRVIDVQKTIKNKKIILLKEKY